MKISKYILPSIFFVLSLWVFTNSATNETIVTHGTIHPKEKITPTNIQSLFDQYDSFIRAELDSTENVGAALAIICDNNYEFIKPYGLRIAGTNDSVNFHTLFRIGSVSKGFAGVLAAKLQQEHIISLDEKVKAFLPTLHLRDSINETNITIKNTLNHTTGLVPHTYDNLIEAGVPLNEIISRLNEVEISGAPGKVYAYQNAMYSLLDTILQVKTHKNYSTHLKEQLFKPLGMNDITTDYLSMAKGSNVAYPHVNSERSLKPNSRYYNMGPAAGINASINDMAIWLKAMLGNYPDVIDTTVQKMISTPTIRTPLKRRYTHRWKNVEEKYYSLGWRIYTVNGYNIIYHGGYVKGYRAEISYCPELKTGAVFMQNSPNRVSSESMPTFWEMYFNEIIKIDNNREQAQASNIENSQHKCKMI